MIFIEQSKLIYTNRLTHNLEVMQIHLANAVFMCMQKCEGIIHKSDPIMIIHIVSIWSIEGLEFCKMKLISTPLNLLRHLEIKLNEILCLLLHISIAVFDLCWLGGRYLTLMMIYKIHSQVFNIHMWTQVAHQMQKLEIWHCYLVYLWLWKWERKYCLWLMGVMIKMQWMNSHSMSLCVLDSL
mgnify:FL=1